MGCDWEGFQLHIVQSSSSLEVVYLGVLSQDQNRIDKRFRWDTWTSGGYNEFKIGGSIVVNDMMRRNLWNGSSKSENPNCSNTCVKFELNMCLSWRYGTMIRSVDPFNSWSTNQLVDGRRCGIKSEKSWTKSPCNARWRVMNYFRHEDTETKSRQISELVNLEHSGDLDQNWKWGWKQVNLSQCGRHQG